MSEAEIREYLRKIGRQGGLKGGPSRALKIGRKRCQEIASAAGKLTWKNRKRKDAT